MKWLSIKGRMLAATDVMQRNRHEIARLLDEVKSLTAKNAELEFQLAYHKEAALLARQEEVLIAAENSDWKRAAALGPEDIEENEGEVPIALAGKLGRLEEEIADLQIEAARLKSDRRASSDVFEQLKVEFVRLKEVSHPDLAGMKRAFIAMFQGAEVMASHQPVIDTPGLISVWIKQERVAVFEVES